jgi:hypothetical protein
MKIPCGKTAGYLRYVRKIFLSHSFANSVATIRAGPKRTRIEQDHGVSAHYAYSTMISIRWLRNLLTAGKAPGTQGKIILPVEEQIKAWHTASRRMAWGIKKEEFNMIETPPSLSDDDRAEGFEGIALFYGFGDDGSGHADPVLSGKIAWEYAWKHKKGRLWQSPYIKFDRPDAFRLRPGAPLRPRGFYFAKIQTGERFLTITVSRARRLFNSITGWGPEGFQFLCITHPHFTDLMSERKTPFMALADYDVAPYGFSDFFDVPQMFSSNRILGLGIGNVDQDYSGFGIPTLRICQFPAP